MKELFMVTMNVSMIVTTCIIILLIEKRILYGKDDAYQSLMRFAKKALPISSGITVASIAVLKYVFHIS